jgi:hypothetical protein
VVASANRGVLGTLRDDSEEFDDELDDVRSLVSGVGRFFSLAAIFISTALQLNESTTAITYRKP